MKTITILFYKSPSKMIEVQKRPKTELFVYYNEGE